ncbi:hypothetical protein JRQ81_012539 [Phrynocephalus forsythii]|uniref:Reverse transcriptase Ty1/copia-type domain-containing protein n=1 Tax=Phrynocephalus forsythii TaxID=171643 RepID=A0A9Q0Y2B5_9SAUR|nr:hypothetical protein JRQ81_012539 [Phrynocephalus forsythii]
MTLKPRETSWDEVQQLPTAEANIWKAASQETISALQKNKTCNLTKLPVGKKAIGCKCIFKAKQDENGHVQRYKARLVAKGYAQNNGEDCDETFAPVVKHTTIGVLLSLAASKKMHDGH